MPTPGTITQQRRRGIDLTTYFGLFLSAFVAATLLPMQSESVLAALLIQGKQSPSVLIAVATAGNVLGSVCNWILGRYIEHWRHHRWFPVSNGQLERAQQRYHHLGRWSLLFSWLPIIGDPLTIIAGVMREPLRWFVPIVLVAKLGRYLVVAAATLGATAL